MPPEARAWSRSTGFAGQAVSDLPPMHQIPAVKNRNPRENSNELLTRLIIVTDPADARIGIKAGQDGILKSFGRPGGKAAGQESTKANSSAMVRLAWQKRNGFK